MGAKWHYSGDVNCQHGGFWYRLNNMHYGYAECWRVTPCSDAGGPDNQFWLEELTVNVPEDYNELAKALKCCSMVEAYESATKAQRAHIAVECCIGYGFYDQCSTEVVQIGAKPDTFTARGFDPVTPDTVLRAGSSLRNYVRRAHLRNA